MATLLDECPVGFLSYAHADDEADEGRLTEFRVRLEREIRVQTGVVFAIFQDRRDLGWGDAWKKRIEDSIDGAAFLIPILTPSYFRSDACRFEFERFVSRERQLGRNDLVFPVYYVSCRELEDSPKTDSLAIDVAGRHHIDWRKLRFRSYSSATVATRMAALAEQLAAAILRTGSRQPEIVRGPDQGTAAISDQGSTLNLPLSRVADKGGSPGSAPASVPELHYLDGSAIDTAYVEQLSLGGKITRYCDDPAQEIPELSGALAGHLPSVDQQTPDAVEPPAATGYHFLDQMTELTIFDIEAFEGFRKEMRGEVAARYPPGITAWEFLSRESLWVDGRLTRTGALLFARNPTAVCPTSMVKCTQYHGNDRTAVREITTFDGTVPAQIVAARQFVADRSRTGEAPSTDQAQLVAVYDYPMVAVREVIANALVHRDHAVTDSCVHVRMFTDRLEVSSPGSWVNRDLSPAEQYNLSSFSGQSKKRNYRLAHVLSFIRLVEGEGSGIPAALSSCDAMQSPEPTVVLEDGFVTVIIRRREPGDGLGNAPSFAEQLKALRLGAQLTFGELADSADLTARIISDLERGIVQTPRPEITQRLADALGLEGPIRASFETAAQGEARNTGILTGGDAKLLTASHRPWSPEQVGVADCWPTRRDQPASVALSPASDRLALSVGHRLVVSLVSESSLGAPLLQVACALSPGLTWSPLGDKLAFRDEDGRARLLDVSGLDLPGLNPGGPVNMETVGTASAVAFSPEGDRLVTLSPSLPGRITLTLLGPDHRAIWDRELPGDRMSSYRSDRVNLAWSPDGRHVACTTGTLAIWLIDAADGRLVGQFEHHSLAVTGLGWIDNERIASASEDATLQVWRPDGSTPATVVETIPAAGMVLVRSQCTALIWSADGDLFAWSLQDAPAQLWYREPSLRRVAAYWTRLAVSAVDNLLALVDPGATELVTVSDWRRTGTTPTGMTTYSNAKVLLLGDSGVGKSGLAMVLAGEKFRATESTHGRRIWRLPATEENDAPDGDREVLVWDLAGQPGYRIVHQLHLGGAALALIVFDSRNETAPLSGVRHWARAVRHAHPLAAGGLPTFLVAARIDRGGISVSEERIDRVRAEFGIDAYFKTSAFNGTNIDLLRSRILAAIDWERIPKITSTALFAVMKRFVIEQKSSGNLLTPLTEMSRAFRDSVPSWLQLLGTERTVADGQGAQEASAAELAVVFEGCVARLESAGLVKRLKIGDYVLLQPELLDAYASGIVNAARDEPDGLGSILESRVIDIDFPVPAVDRVPGEQERLLVYATLEELIQYELVLREDTEDGMQLVFPAAYRRDLPTSEAPKGDGVMFRFEGPIDNIYSTLIVRLTRSNQFTRIATWQSAARFAAEGGECTVFLKSDGDGKAELWIGYDGVPRQLRLQFERFVHAQLDRRATPGTVSRERQYACPEDGATFTPEAVEQVRRLGRDSILCPVCEKRIPMRDDYESIAGTDHLTAAMEESADRGRESEAASTVLRGKEEVAEFDVFLCHNVVDKPAVREIAQRLRGRGLRPWLDEHELRPGMPWQLVLEGQIQSIPAVIVVVGSEVGPWQDQELTAFLRQFVKRGCPVIPVLLPGVERPELPALLDGLPWVDLAVADPDPLDQMEWGITGKLRT